MFHSFPGYIYIYIRSKFWASSELESETRGHQFYLDQMTLVELTSFMYVIHFIVIQVNLSDSGYLLLFIYTQQKANNRLHFYDIWTVCDLVIGAK